MTEITVTVKSAESTYRQKFLIYEDYTLSQNDPIIKSCIDAALDSSKIEPEEIKIRALLQVR